MQRLQPTPERPHEQRTHVNTRRPVASRPFRLVATFACVAALVTAVQAHAMCFEEAGQRYGIAPELLAAIAQVESSMNPAAINGSHEKRTGSVDLGLMQINSRHLPRLQQWGITREALLSDACLNVMVGAWILADHIERHGADWNGIGSYNAACTQLRGQACTDARNTYAWKVYRALNRQNSRTGTPARGAAQPLTTTQARQATLRSLELVASADIREQHELNQTNEQR